MAEYKSLIPIMTSNSQDGFVISATSSVSSTTLYKALDGVYDGTTYHRSSATMTLPDYFTVQFPKKFIIGKYTIYLGYYNTQYGNMNTWDFEGLVNGNWITLHSGSHAQVAEALTFTIAPIEVEGVRIKCKTRFGSNTWGFDDLTVYEYRTINKILLLSNGESYSLKNEEVNHTTNMTSNTAPSPFVASASSINSTSYPTWYAFNGSNTSSTQCWMTAVNFPTGWIQIDYGSLKRVNRLTLTSRNDATASTMSPKDFKVLGSTDGLTFTPLTTITNQTIWTSNQTVVFDFDNPNSYRYYRLEITANNGATTTAVGEILYSYVDRTLLEVNKGTDVIKYGADSIKDLNMSMRKKGYLMTTFNNNEQGLREKQLTKKPLSIRFD